MRLLRNIVVAAGLLLLCSAASANDGNGAGPSMEMPHRMMLLVLQVGTIILSTRLGSAVFRKLRLPEVMGELTAGILIGPYLLGSLPIPGLPDGLFPKLDGNFPVSPELYGICSIASIILLFMVGLETDVRLFMRYSLAGTLVGIGGVVFSFLIGDLMGVFLLPLIRTGQYSFGSPECLFLGIMSTATSVGITARILSEKRKLDSPEGVTILAGAVIDDVLGIIVLAITLGVISSSHESGSINWLHIGVIAAKAIGIWLAATVTGLLAARRISAILKLLGNRAAIAAIAFGFALMLAGLFEEAGLAMIIGAYVMGLALSRTDISHVVREHLEPVFMLLVPIFFAVMGMMVNIKLILSVPVMTFGLSYAVLAIAAKMLGCGIPALFCNFNLRGAARIGAGMVPRGEVALIMAGIGLSAGVLSQEVFGSGIVMTLVTTILAPPVLVLVFKGNKPGTRSRSEGSEISDISTGFQLPSDETARLMMTKLLPAFEREGFFVHAISRTENLYQMLKDNIVITLRRDQSQISFDCQKGCIPLVNTIMLEAVSEMEHALSELRKPLDTAKITNTLVDHIAGVPDHPTLKKFISPASLAPALLSRTKSDVILELLEILKAAGLLSDTGKAADDVMKREAAMSTGIKNGIAIPHARTDVVDRLVCAIGISHEGIDFDAMDGAASHIFVLTLSPRAGTAPHMQFMSMISQVLNEEGRSALLKSRTSNEMYKILTCLNGH